MRNFYILGAGIGGLSVAHLLAKDHPSSTITIIEKNDIVGGQARSTRNEEGKFMEYCWHAFGTGYKHLNELLCDAKLDDRLIPVSKYIYDSDVNDPYDNNSSYIEGGRNFLGSGNLHQSIKAFQSMGIHMDMQDLYGLLKIFIQYKQVPYISSMPFDQEDNVTWMDFCKVIHNPRLYNWLVGFPSIYLGMDAVKVSVKTVLDLARSSTGTDLEYDFKIPDGPVNERILDPWVDFLKTKYNVKFMINTEVTKIEASDNVVTSIHIKTIGNRALLESRLSSSPLARNGNIEDNITIIKLNPGLDTVINSLDVGGFTNLIHTINAPKSELLATTFIKYKQDWCKLRAKSYQLQTQVLFELNEYLEWRSDKGVLLIYMESPWCLMARVESNVWKKPEGELLSCGIGRWDVKSELYNKLPCQLSPEELAKECWHQMSKYGNDTFHTTKHVKGKLSNKSINEIGYKESRVWPYYYKDGKLVTSEPKFSNNIGCYELRPTPKDKFFDNVYHSNAYARQVAFNYSNPDLYCMENAATIAFKVAALLT
jgi:hypothetical protein